MNFLIGFALPALVGTVNRYITSSTGRFWASTMICAMVGIIVNFIEHNGPPGYARLTLLEITNTFGESILFMIGAAKVSYEGFFNNEKILRGETVLEKLDLKTNKK